MVKVGLDFLFEDFHNIHALTPIIDALLGFWHLVAFIKTVYVFEGLAQWTWHLLV